MSTAIVWFRNDLRVHDHEALHHAVNEYDTIVPVYCFDPRHFEKTSWGFPKTGGHRTRFLIESVANLRENLQQLGGDLMVCTARPEAVLPELADRFEATHLFAYGEPAAEEQTVQASVKEHVGIACSFFWGHSLFHLDDIPYAPDAIPKTFTNFRKQVEKKSDVRPCFPNPEQVSVPESLSPGALPSADTLGVEASEPDERAVLPFKGGERAAARRLKHYFWEEDQLKSYKFTRNGLMGADYSSKFSPWLANGSLSPRKIYWQVKAYEDKRTSNVSTYWMIFELIWRDYFRFGYLRHGNDYFHAGGIQQKRRPDWNSSEEDFRRWAKGQTGIPFIDANMRELNATGYMSNRGRQNVASFFSQNLYIDWRKGAEYFESMLLDYDPYSNYGNWMYNSTVGHDSRTRYFNIIKQARKYDEKGEYVKHWLPELQDVPAEKVHEPHILHEEEQEQLELFIGEDYPEPMLELEESYQTIQDRS